MILSYSGRLAHTAETWESMHLNEVPNDLKQQGVTPGRVSAVFMCPDATFNKCKDKPANWGVKSGFGRAIPMATGKEQRARDQIRSAGPSQINQMADVANVKEGNDIGADGEDFICVLHAEEDDE